MSLVDKIEDIISEHSKNPSILANKLNELKPEFEADGTFGGALEGAPFGDDRLKKAIEDFFIMKYSTLSSFTDIIPMCRILLVKDDSCNDEESTICHIMNQTTIHRMSFGSSIGCYVTSFHIDNCPSLQKIDIASSSFNRVDLQHTSFAITNCPSLESIDIGDNSFMYFSSFKFKFCLQRLLMLNNYHTMNLCSVTHIKCLIPLSYDFLRNFFENLNYLQWIQSFLD